MKSKLKLSKIGNSRGIRLPKRIIDHYGFEDEILVEELDDNLLLTPVRRDQKLDWETTFKEMADSDENWDEWDALETPGNEGIEDW